LFHGQDGSEGRWGVGVGSGRREWGCDYRGCLGGRTSDCSRWLGFMGSAAWSDRVVLLAARSAGPTGALRATLSGGRGLYGAQRYSDLCGKPRAVGRGRWVWGFGAGMFRGYRSPTRSRLQRLSARSGGVRGSIVIPKWGWTGEFTARSRTWQRERHRRHERL